MLCEGLLTPHLRWTEGLRPARPVNTVPCERRPDGRASGSVGRPATTNVQRSNPHLPRSVECPGFDAACVLPFIRVDLCDLWFNTAIQSPSPAFDQPNPAVTRAPRGKECDSFRRAGHHAVSMRTTRLTGVAASDGPLQDRPLRHSG